MQQQLHGRPLIFALFACTQTHTCNTPNSLSTSKHSIISYSGEQQEKSCKDKVSVGTDLNVCVHSVALVCLCSVYMYSHSKRVFISVFICFFSTFILCSCNFLTYLYPTEIHSRTDIFQDVAMIVILFS